MTNRSMALGAFLLLLCGCSSSSASGESADAAADTAAEDQGVPDVALDSTDDVPGPRDAMGSADAGASDAEADAEAGPYACSPGDVSGFAPSWHPPLVQSACTSTELDTYIADCWGPNSSGSACSSFEQSDPACFNCMTTFDTATAWGALVESSGQQLVYGDFSDCLAIETGDKSSTSCAAISQAAEECTWAACSGPTCPPATTAAEVSLVSACDQATYDGGCAAQWNAEQACVNGLYASGSVGTAAVQKCSFGTYGSYDIYFRALGGIFCGAPSDAGAPTDAGAD